METMQLQEKECPEKKTKKLGTFLKKHIKPIIVILAVLLLVFAATTTVSSVKAHKVKKQLEHKIFVTEAYHDDRWMDVYAFKDGKVATEKWYLDSLEREGNFDDYDHKYKIVASIFSEKINIMAKYPHGWVKVVAVYLDEAGVVQHYKYTEDMPDWQEITLEDAERLRIQNMCDHDFDEPIIIRVATCSQPGEGKKVCKKCELEQIYATYEPHNYVNKVCSVCGAKKAVAKADIDANTWYTYNEGPLHIQNCVVQSAVVVSQGKAMMVQYKAVCQHCHAIDELSQLAGPEVNYEVKKICYCDECGESTLVRFKID